MTRHCMSKLADKTPKNGKSLGEDSKIRKIKVIFAQNGHSRAAGRVAVSVVKCWCEKGKEKKRKS